MDKLKELQLEYLPNFPDSIQPLRDFIVQHKWQIGATVSIGYASWKLLTGKRKKLPPGPKGLPWIGTPDVFDGNSKEKLRKLHQEYGDVVYFQMFGKGMIFLMTHKMIKDAFVQKGFTFNHRLEQEMMAFTLMGGDDEIFCAPVNEEWTANKKLAAGALRKFGSKQSDAEEKIINEMSVFLDYLRLQKGQPVDFNKRILNVTANVIHSIVFDERFDHDDPQLADFTELVCTWIRDALNLTTITSVFPMWLGSIVYRSKMKAAQELGNKLTKYVSQKFDQHRNSFDPNNIRDFTDVYLNERLGKTDFNFQKTVSTIMIFLPDALDGVGNMLAIIMAYLAEKQSSQHDIQEQIDLAVGNDKDVLLRHRSAIPKLDSFIMESFRHAPPFASTATHTTQEDTQLNGYDIPKNTGIMGMLENAMFNAEDFQDPDAFDPHRFLDEDGKLIKTDIWIPFGMGRRMCMGEQLVKMEVFLILGNLLKTFTFKFEDQKQKAEIKPQFLKRAPAYRLIFTPR